MRQLLRIPFFVRKNGEVLCSEFSDICAVLCRNLT